MACGDSAHRRGRGGLVVGHGVRQHHGVGRGVGQVEGAAEGVAELVVQAHADRAEAPAGQPGTVEQLIAGVEAVAVGAQRAEARDERTDGLVAHLVGLSSASFE